MLREDTRVGQRGAVGRWPADVASGPAFLAPFVLCVLAGTALPLAMEVVALAAVVAVFGWCAGAPAGLLAVGSALLSLNGFREDRLGVLALHPRVDLPVAAALLFVWAVAWSGHEVAARSAGRR